MNEPTELAGTVIDMPSLAPRLQRNGSTLKECGYCRMCTAHMKDLSVGYCHANPPILLGMDPRHGPQFCRPLVRLKDPACRHFEASK